MFKWRSINCHPMLSCFITTKKRIFLVPHFAATIHFRFYSIVRSSLFCVLSVSPDNDLQSCSVKSALRFCPLILIEYSALVAITPLSTTVSLSFILLKNWFPKRRLSTKQLLRKHDDQRISDLLYNILTRVYLLKGLFCDNPLSFNDNWLRFFLFQVSLDKLYFKFDQSCWVFKKEPGFWRIQKLENIFLKKDLVILKEFYNK